MATFDANTVGSDVSPSYSPVLEIKPQVTTVKMGDGYEQRLVRGLAANKRYHVISLVFNISQSDADTINTFLNPRFDDQDAFQYTIGGESSARNFKCTRRSSSIPYNNRVTMNLTFEEVFEA